MKKMSQYRHSVGGTSSRDSISPSKIENPTTKFEQERIAMLQQERVNIQKKAFTNWCNSFLEQAGIQISDLFKDLSDGKALMKLLEVLAGQRVGRPTRGSMRVHKLENVHKCLNFLDEREARFANIGAEDIVDGNQSLILGLIWTIILRFQIVESVQKGDSTIEGTSPKQSLLLWCQSKIQGYPHVKIENFTKSWCNGLGFNALIHAHRPDLINYTALKPDDHIGNLNNAFNVAENKLGISRLLDAEDVDVEEPDELSIMTYVSSYHSYFINNMTSTDGVPAKQSQQTETGKETTSVSKEGTKSISHGNETETKEKTAVTKEDKPSDIVQHREQIPVKETPGSDKIPDITHKSQENEEANVGAENVTTPSKPLQKRKPTPAEELQLLEAVHLEIAMARLDLNRNNRIGAGNFGLVYRCELDGTPVAVKEITIPGRTKSKITASIINEIKVSLKIRHPAVVQFMGYSLDKQTSCVLLIYELIDGHNLDDIIGDETLMKAYNFTLATRYGVLVQVSEGLAFLHLQKPAIVHGDIKPANVMLTRHGRVKLCDLGLSKFKYSSNISTTAGGGRGTPLYMAPEQLLFRKSSSAASDVYSFGASAYEVIFEEYMWDPEELERAEDDETDEVTLLKQLIETQRISKGLQQKQGHPVYGVIARCVQFEYQKRPAALEVVKELKELQEKLNK